MWCPDSAVAAVLTQKDKIRKFYLMDIQTKKFFAALAVIAAASIYPAAAQQQDGKPDVMELAENEATRLEKLLDLEVWQVFYVDSTLKHDYAAMQADLEKFQKAKVSNVSMYVSVQDKWMDTIDSTYKAIFTEDQWAAYLKSGAAKQQKARAKRKAKSDKALEK